MMAKTVKPTKPEDKNIPTAAKTEPDLPEECQIEMQAMWEKLLANLLSKLEIKAAQWVLKEKLSRPLEENDLYILVRQHEELSSTALPLIYDVLEKTDDIDHDFLVMLMRKMSSTGTYWGDLPELIIKFNPQYDKIRTFITDCVNNRKRVPDTIRLFIGCCYKDLGQDNKEKWLSVSLENGKIELAELLAELFFKRNLTPDEVKIVLHYAIQQADRTLAEKAHNFLRTTWNKTDCDKFISNKLDAYLADTSSGLIDVIETARYFEKEFNLQVDRGIWRDIARAILDKAEKHLAENYFLGVFEMLSTYDLSEYLCRDYVRMENIKLTMLEKAKALMLKPNADSDYEVEWAWKIFKFFQVYRLEAEFVDQALDIAKKFKQTWNSITLTQIARYGASQDKIDELYREGEFDVDQADFVGASLEAKEARLAILIKSNLMSDLKKIEWLCQNIGRELTLEELKILVITHQPKKKK